MSVKAINWALEQKGLKPSAKLVLVCLADRHNKDTGACFPSQDTLADDACISRSSLNDQLNTLEALGFFTREAVIDPVTKRQRATQYTLNIGHSVSRIQTRAERKAVSENDQKPCPKNAKSRVRNSDTNQEDITKKRTLTDDESPEVSLENFEAELELIVGAELLTAEGRVEARRWFAAAPAALILQLVSEQSARAGSRRIRSLNYFSESVMALAAEAARHLDLPAGADRPNPKPKPRRDMDALMLAALTRLNEDGAYPQ